MKREFLISLHPATGRDFVCPVLLDEQELAGDIHPTLHVPNSLGLFPFGTSDLGGVLGSA